MGKFLIFILLLSHIYKCADTVWRLEHERYTKPKPSMFSTAVSNAIKVLNDIKKEWETHGHSPRSGSKGEESPLLPCFKDLYKTFIEIHSGATTVVTQSEKNHQIQKTIIGSSPPIGADTQACARSSSNSQNKKNGHATVARGKRLPTALLPSSSEEESDSSISEGGSQKKKRGKKKKKTDPQSTIEKHTEASANMTNAVVSLIGTMGGGKNEGQDEPAMVTIKQSEMNLKKEQFEHMKDIETKKFEFIKLRFKQKQESKKLEREHTRETRKIELLKLELDQAKDNYRNESDDFLKEMAKEDVKRAHGVYVKALTKLSES